MPQFNHRADYACLTVSGEDAASFLQGQLSSDVNAGAAGAGQLASLNTAKGRVMAMTRLLRIDGTFYLVLPADLADAVLAHLRRFVLRARARIERIPNRIYGLVSAGKAPPKGPDLAILTLPAQPSLHLAIDLDPTRDALPLEGWSEIPPQRWEQMEIEAGIPEVFAATSERFVAQMINLDLLGGVSFSKGCYVGQEIIARAHHLGRIKRRMGLFHSPGDAAAGDPVWAGGRQVGSVVRSVATDQGLCPLLATLPADAVDPGLGENGPALEAAELPYAIPEAAASG